MQSSHASSNSTCLISRVLQKTINGGKDFVHDHCNIAHGFSHFFTSIPLQKIETSPTRRLAQSDNNHHPRASMTCDVVPRVCRSAGSPGPDCCRKQCVNVETDAQNCGQCGKKCRYGEVCCRGSCVNVLFDPGNCGRCKNKCLKGGYCRHGMGNYA